MGRGLNAMKMNPSSQVALLVIACASAILGSMILSPDGRLLPLFVAGLIAVILLSVDSSLIKKCLALLLLASVVYLILPAWKQYRSHLDQYRNRATSGGKTNIAK